jgi:hypothetical protein
VRGFFALLAEPPEFGPGFVQSGVGEPFAPVEGCGEGVPGQLDLAEPGVGDAAQV